MTASVGQCAVAGRAHVVRVRGTRGLCCMLVLTNQRGAAMWTLGPHGRSTGACTGISNSQEARAWLRSRAGTGGTGFCACAEGSRGAHAPGGGGAWERMLLGFGKEALEALDMGEAQATV
jgi:hypothetical protein